MSDPKKAQLSTFIDGEIDDNEKGIIDHMLKDQELMDTWSRYHLISGCINRQLPEYLDRRLADNISQSLHDEPAIVAVPSPDNRSRFQPFMKPVAGFAIAASVAALAILGVQQQRPGEAPQPLQETVAKTTLATSDIAAATTGSIRAPVREVSSQGSPGSQRAAFQPDRPGHVQENTHTHTHRHIANYDEYRIGDGRQGISPIMYIFIEEKGAETNKNAGHYSVGGINAFARDTKGHQVTAVGEVSQATVQRMANSVISLVEDRERKAEDGGQ